MHLRERGRVSRTPVPKERWESLVVPDPPSPPRVVQGRVSRSLSTRPHSSLVTFVCPTVADPGAQDGVSIAVDLTAAQTSVETWNGPAARVVARFLSGDTMPATRHRDSGGGGRSSTDSPIVSLPPTCT